MSKISLFRQASSNDIVDSLLQFALNLEYLEVEYYQNYANVNFSNSFYKGLSKEIYDNEVAHVNLYNKKLGSKSIEKPDIDIEGAFNGAALAAGLIKEGEEFNPFADEISFLLGGMLIEDVGVTAYTGASSLIEDKELRNVICGILAVESHHMGAIRSIIYQSGEDNISKANKIIDARKQLSTTKGTEEHINNNNVNIIPSDENAVGYHRKPREVLDIVFLEKGSDRGGFFPNGLNGEIQRLL
jgi:rubrerythrin